MPEAAAGDGHVVSGRWHLRAGSDMAPVPDGRHGRRRRARRAIMWSSVCVRHGLCHRVGLRHPVVRYCIGCKMARDRRYGRGLSAGIPAWQSALEVRGSAQARARPHRRPSLSRLLIAGRAVPGPARRCAGAAEVIDECEPAGRQANQPSPPGADLLARRHGDDLIRWSADLGPGPHGGPATGRIPCRR